MNIAKKISGVNPKAKFAPGNIIALKNIDFVIPYCPEIASKLGYPEINRIEWCQDTAHKIEEIFLEKKAKILCSKEINNEKEELSIVHVIEANGKRLLIFEEGLEWATAHLSQ